MLLSLKYKDLSINLETHEKPGVVHYLQSQSSVRKVEMESPRKLVDQPAWALQYCSKYLAANTVKGKCVL